MPLHRLIQILFCTKDITPIKNALNDRSIDVNSLDSQKRTPLASVLHKLCVNTAKHMASDEARNDQDQVLIVCFDMLLQCERVDRSVKVQNETLEMFALMYGDIVVQNLLQTDGRSEAGRTEPQSRLLHYLNAAVATNNVADFRTAVENSVPDVDSAALVTCLECVTKLRTLNGNGFNAQCNRITSLCFNILMHNSTTDINVTLHETNMTSYALNEENNFVANRLLDHDKFNPDSQGGYYHGYGSVIFSQYLALRIISHSKYDPLKLLHASEFCNFSGDLVSTRYSQILLRLDRERVPYIIEIQPALHLLTYVIIPPVWCDQRTTWQLTKILLPYLKIALEMGKRFMWPIRTNVGIGSKTCNDVAMKLVLSDEGDVDVHMIRFQSDGS